MRVRFHRRSFRTRKERRQAKASSDDESDLKIGKFFKRAFGGVVKKVFGKKPLAGLLQLGGLLMGGFPGILMGMASKMASGKGGLIGKVAPWLSVAQLAKGGLGGILKAGKGGDVGDWVRRLGKRTGLYKGSIGAQHTGSLIGGGGEVLKTGVKESKLKDIIKKAAGKDRVPGGIIRSSSGVGFSQIPKTAAEHFDAMGTGVREKFSGLTSDVVKRKLEREAAPGIFGVLDRAKAKTTGVTPQGAKTFLGMTGDTWGKIIQSIGPVSSTIASIQESKARKKRQDLLDRFGLGVRNVGKDLFSSSVDIGTRLDALRRGRSGGYSLGGGSSLFDVENV